MGASFQISCKKQWPMMNSGDSLIMNVDEDCMILGLNHV